MPHHDEPNWEDVRWDHGAADAAIGALGRAAGAIDELLGDEARVAGEATAEWRGGAREAFERRRRTLREELARLAADCRRTAAAVGRASAQAEQEQRRRERERAEWERDEERRRRHHG